MTPAAQATCKPILNKLDSRVRQGMIQRIDAMVRELEFLEQREDPGLALLRRAGWGDDHFHVIFMLNSFYQRVLGPEKSAARKGPQGLGATIAVHHGSTIFDSKSAQEVTSAERSFKAMNKALNVDMHWLYANTCRDLIHTMAGLGYEERDIDE